MVKKIFKKIRVPISYSPFLRYLNSLFGKFSSYLALLALVLSFIGISLGPRYLLIISMAFFIFSGYRIWRKDVTIEGPKIISEWNLPTSSVIFITIKNIGIRTAGDTKITISPDVAAYEDSGKSSTKMLSDKSFSHTPFPLPINEPIIFPFGISDDAEYRQIFTIDIEYTDPMTKLKHKYRDCRDIRAYDDAISEVRDPRQELKTIFLLLRIQEMISKDIPRLSEIKLVVLEI